MKKFFASVLICALLLSVLAGCSLNPDDFAYVPYVSDSSAPVDYEQLYSGILDGMYKLISSGLTEDCIVQEGEAGVAEVIMYIDSSAALGSIGYTIHDISGDGVPELIIGSIPDESVGCDIYAVYTCDGDKPMLAFEGWSRNLFRVIGEGKFLNVSSGGAMYTSIGVYTIALDGRSLICDDLYFTEEKDESFSEMGFYHNTTGEMKKEASEEISEEQFRDKEAELSNQIQYLELTPFTEYVSLGGEVSSADVPAVSPTDVSVEVMWAEDAADITDYDVIGNPEGEYSSAVLFKPTGVLRNFTLYSLSLENVDESGKIHFAIDAQDTIDELSRPLVVYMTFAGDIPNNGFSYVDGNGETVFYAVSISGEDGSVFLWQF